MTEAQYKERNLQGFEGDTFMKEKFAEIIERRKIDTVIETGTYLGGTTRQLSAMVKNVITIEIDGGNYFESGKNLSECKNVIRFHGSSPSILHNIFNESDFTKNNLLLLLDAHWGNVCPLKDEMKVIALAKLKPVLVIHDFVVPGTDLGYDSYNGQPFTFDWIKKDIEAIYGENGYLYYYNKEATGARRGIIYIEPLG